MIGSNLEKSIIWDEPVFIMNGLYYLQEGITYNSNQPILGGILNAIPLTILGVEPLPYDQINYLFRDAKFVFPYYGDNDLAEITFWARIGTLLFSLIVALYVYKWAKELYGIKAGIFALFMYCFSITILAWSVSANQDLLCIGLLFITFYYFWKYLNTNEKKYLIYTGIFYGLALSAKVTALFLIPIFFINYLIFNHNIQQANLKKIILTILTIVILSWFTLTLVHIGDARPLYDINDPFYQHGIGLEFRSEEKLESILDKVATEDSYLRPYLKKFITEVPIPGATFYQAIYTHSQDSSGGKDTGRISFLHGEWKEGGWWYFYFVAFLIKEAIPILIFWLASFVFFKWTKHKEWKTELSLLTPVIIWIFIFSFITRIDTGFRHMLLVFPFLFVFSSKLITLKIKEKYTTITKIIFYALCIWLIIITFITFPFYTSYFNEFIGGSENGYRWLSSDNIDGGQDMMHIKRYMDEHNLTSIKLEYLGVEKPEYRNVSYEPLTCEPTTGIIIISASSLQGASYDNQYRDNGPDMECFSWLWERKPDEYIGYSILVYNITEDQQRL